MSSVQNAAACHLTELCTLHKLNSCITRRAVNPELSEVLENVKKIIAYPLLAEMESRLGEPFQSLTFTVWNPN